MNNDWVIPCRFVEIHDNLGTIIGAGVDTWWLPTLPSVIQAPAAVRLLAAPGELEQGSEHEIRNAVYDPAGNKVSEVGGKGQFGGAGHEDWLSGITLATIIKFEATAAGTWHFEHSIDDSSVKIPLHVKHGSHPGLTLPPPAP